MKLNSYAKSYWRFDHEDDVPSRLCCVLVEVNTFFGQDQSEIFEWIDSDVALVGVFQNIDKIGEFVTNLGVWPNKYWEHAIELATDENFGVFASEDFRQIEKASQSLLAELKAVEQLVIVVHEFDGTNSKISLLIKSNPKDGANLIELINRLKQTTHVAEQLNVQSIVSKFNVELTDDWVFMSNDESCLSAIKNRQAGKAVDALSLTASRKFKMVKATIAPTTKGSCIVQAYGAPGKINQLFPQYSERTWSALKFEEMPSFGLQVFVAPRVTSSNNEPKLALSFGTTISMTFPRSGQGKLIASYLPVNDLPQQMGNELSFSTYAFDPQLQFEAKKEIFENRTGKRTYEEHLKRVMAPFDPRDLKKDIIPMSDGKTTVTYLDSSGSLKTLEIESIADFNTAERWADGLLFVEERAAIKDESRFKRIGYAEGILIQRKSNNGGLGPRFGDTHFINSRWHFFGDSEEVLRRSEHAENAVHIKDYDFGNLVSQLMSNSRIDATPFRIDYSSAENHMIFAESFERLRIIRKYKNLKKRDKLLYARGGENGHRLEIDSKQDTMAVLPVMFWKGIFQCFDSRVVLYSNEDNILRVTGGLTYSNDK